MVVNKAASLFHGPEKYNCCQAVLKAFEDIHDISEERVIECKAFGGGRAPDGMCGALYAAHLLIEDQEVKDKVQEEFLKTAGSTRCREIKQLGTLDCKGCVMEAAKLVSKMSK